MKTFHQVRLLLRRSLSALLVAGCVLACQKETEEPPEGLIPEDKMAQILSEIHLAEAKASKVGVMAPDSTALIYQKLEKQIYARHKVDTATYTRSYIYYSTNPDRMVDVYKKVVEKLTKKTDSSASKKPAGLR